MAENEIHSGEFIVEYMGEYLNLETVKERQVYQRENEKMNYILSLKEVFGNGEEESVHIGTDIPRKAKLNFSRRWSIRKRSSFRESLVFS